MLSPYVDAGLPVVGLEPSCTAALRGDLPELLADDPRAARVSAAVRTLAELLTERRADRVDPARPDATSTCSPSRTATSTPRWASAPTSTC